MSILTLLVTHEPVHVDAGSKRNHLLHHLVFLVVRFQRVHLLHKWLLIHYALREFKVILVDPGRFFLFVRIAEGAWPHSVAHRRCPLILAGSAGSIELFLLFLLKNTMSVSN